MEENRDGTDIEPVDPQPVQDTLLASGWAEQPRPRVRGASLKFAGPPPKIRGYVVSELLGIGGMATVWRARQHGTGRDVALKLLTERPSDNRAKARFIREVELACRLEHPNVARVYESGVDEGHYYYAMELVDGVPLDQFVRDSRLDTRAMLALMRTICDAVQHAHYKGIIHRDLKPSNILVTADGHPRVLDFGLARPITLGQAERVTEDHAGWSGTPAYMSPEQACGRDDQIDTRCDVYSLGKVLYEMLVGRPAHDLSGSKYDLWRRVVEQEVCRPRAIKRSLHSDIEAVLLKALDREPRNSYGSAGELGKDLANLLKNEPVSARPATITYFLGKKLARHWVAVAVAAIFVLTLAGLTIYGYARIARERNLAIIERRRADVQRVLADEERSTAQRQAANAQAINHFFQHVLDALDPKNARGINNVSREMMDRADLALSETFAGDVQTEASIRVALGRNMLALGQFATAEAQLSRAVALMTPASGGAGADALDAMDLLAQVQRERGEISSAAQLEGRVNEQCRALFGARDSRTLRAMNTLAYILDDLGQRDKAEDTCREALALSGATKTPADLSPGASSEMSLTLASTLTRLLRETGDPIRIADAEAWARSALSVRLSQASINLAIPTTGPVNDAPIAETNDPRTLEAMHDLACVLIARSMVDAGRSSCDEAIRLHRYVVQRGTEVLGPDHPDLIIWRGDLAAALMTAGHAQNLSEAESIYRAILPVATEIRGSEHRYTVVILRMLAEVNSQLGRVADAKVYCTQVETYARRASERLTREFGPGNAQALPFLDALAAALSYERKFAESEQVYVNTLETRRTLRGPTHRETLYNALSLARLRTIAGFPLKARPLLDQTLLACQQSLPPNDPLTAEVRQEIEALPKP